MKILLIGLPTSYDKISLGLQNEGHEVTLYDGQEDLLFLNDGSDLVIEKVTQVIQGFGPDVIVNGVPKLVLPVGDYTLLSNTPETTKLESEKWDTRVIAETAGFKLPTVAIECMSHDLDLTGMGTVYVKPKDATTSQCVWKIPEGSYADELKSPESYPVYVEDSVDYDVESWAYFTVSNGLYSINRCIGVVGYGNDKLIAGNPDWTIGITMAELTEEQEAKWVSVCEALLTDVATLGGSFEGNIQGCIDENLDCYFFEVNVRPETHNSNVYFSYTYNWLESLMTDPSRANGHLAAQYIQETL